MYTHSNAESKGIEIYSNALKIYKAGDFENAYKEFGRVQYGSSLKQSALFRQARCAENLGRKDKAIAKYHKIINSHSKTSIVPISEYNMANIMYETGDSRAKSHYLHLQKKYPLSDYAIISNYFLGKLEINNDSKINALNKISEKKAIEYFKNYIEKAPSGRYSLNAIEELIKLPVSLTNYDNLLIAKSYYQNGEYEKAKQYLSKTTLSESWADFAKTEFKTGNTEKVKYYTEKGLKEFADTVSQEDIYEVIDNYIAIFPTRKDGIKTIVSFGLKSNGADYVSYLNCNEVVENDSKEACYRTLYEKYPNGRFSADALYNIFMSKYIHKKYYDAQRLGFLHLKKFPNVNRVLPLLILWAK